MTTHLAKSIFQNGHTAVITGASSGIGRATALYCASVGMNVWMVDIDEEELHAARDLVASKATNPPSQNITARVANVADLTAMQELAQDVFANNAKCHFLMNNAGIGAGGNSMTDMAVVHKVMSVNTYGPMHGCLAFLPHLKTFEEESLICNTGSKQGVTMPPGNTTYNMSKAALKCYTEGLEHDLYKERLQKQHKVHAALLIPGWVNTSIVLKQMRREDKDESLAVFHEAKPASGAWMPNEVVEFMLEELDKGRFYIVCPDNDVDRRVDNLRMTWTMQDITENRPPLSRWHENYKDKFQSYVKENLNK